MNPRIYILILVSSLYACGFHLRGYEEIPSPGTSSNIILVSDSAPAVAAEVTSLLTLRGVRIITAQDEADYILTLGNETFNREVLSVSAETGKVREYQLTLHTVMSLSDTKGKNLVNNESVAITRDYTFDDSSILGKSNEEAVLRKDLVRQVSMQIVRRFNAVTK